MGAMDELINPTAINSLTRTLSAAAPGIRFTRLRATRTRLDGLKLRARTDLLTAALLRDLPDDYRAAAAIFRRALVDPAFTGWTMWPVTETVTTLALDADSADAGAFEDGLTLLAQARWRHGVR